MSKPPPLQLLVNGSCETNETPLTPASTSLDYLGSTLKSRRTLKQLWHEADQAFFDETGYHLETATPLHKDGVLQKWEGRYNGEKSSMQDKLDRLAPILQNIVNGVEIVGGFAASAASAVFGPAQMCFNAITFVLDAPGKIKHVYDCLEALFKEVANFLVKFRVLERIDELGRLDVELLENANKLLISFTHVCAVAAKLLKKKRHVLQALETVFLTNDGGVQAALAEFQKLANNQAQTVGIVSLEHVLRSENLSQQILSEQNKVTAYFRNVAANENDEKTRLVNKQKIADIENKLFPKSELEKLDQTQQTIYTLPGTLDVLIASKQYIAWSTIKKAGFSELFLSGSNGTGKTYLIEALRDHLIQMRQKMLKQGPSLYVAYHSFADRRTTATSSNVGAQALKNLALQVANQSTRYAEELSNQLRDQKLIGEDDSKKVWSSLKLLDFNSPPGSVMYLLIDGLQGDEGYKSMQALRRVFADAKTTHSVSGKFKVCILLAGEPQALHTIDPYNSTVIDMKELNGKLLSLFIDRELRAHEILTESDQKIATQRVKFAKALLDKSEGNFNAARQKIKRMKEALDDDATSLELEAIIEEDVQQTFDQQARETLNVLADGLSPKHRSQLERIFVWMLYGLPSTDTWMLTDLQAVLRLEQKDQTLESLSKKITTRFHKIFETDYRLVWLDYGIEQYLRQFKDSKPSIPEEDARLISMTINIKNARKDELQRFVLDLSAHLASDTSIFSRDQIDSQECRIQISEVKALVEVTLLSLTALNEGVPDDAASALTYGFRWLPRHFTELWKIQDKIPSADVKQIQAGLATFLSEPYYLEYGPDLEPQDSWEEAWFGESKDANSFSSWLGDCLHDLASHRHLQARQRRWLKHAATRNDGRPDYLKEVALAIAGRWRAACLQNSITRAQPCYEWLGGYLESLAMTGDECDQDQNKSVTANGIAESDNDPNETNRSSSAVIEKPTSRSGDDVAIAGKVPTAEAPKVKAAVQRLHTVAQWTEENLPSVRKDAAHFYCIAVSLTAMEEYDAAIEYFEKAKSDDQLGWRALVGMACNKALQKLPDEATALYRQAISLARTRCREKMLAKHEFDIFVAALRELANILAEKLKQTEEAVQCLREILDHSPEDGLYRWSLFTALCKAEHYGEASELLDAWTQRPEECGNKSPSEALCEMATKDAEMSTLFDAAREQTLRNRLLGILQQAADDAGSRSQRLEQTRMLYVLATAYASSSSSDDHSDARRYLEQIFEQSQIQLSNRDELDHVLREALRFVSRIIFDEFRKQISSHGPTHEHSLETLRDDFNSSIIRTGSALSDFDVHIFWRVAGLCTIIGQSEGSCSLLKQVVNDGVQILSDEDSENDYWGADWLLRAFSCCRNDVDARIAYSILDRTARKKRLLGIGQAQNPEKDAALYEASLRRCEICDEQLKSIDGYWICRWCPDIDFCQPCLESFQKGEKYYEHCSPDHDFIHFYHPECGEEELEAGKVMIDWEIQYEANGDFSRKGGRLVDMTEWLEKLRVKWDLPAPSTDTRAQA